MRVLALDTATEACSVALLSEREEIVRSVEIGRGHADRILGLIDEVLTAGDVALAELDGIVASVGPGAFTGVRISVAVAQGLAFGARRPVVPVMTLEALALERLEGATPSDIALVCLDARMGEVYCGCYGADAVRGVRALGRARVSAPSAVAHVVIGALAGARDADGAGAAGGAIAGAGGATRVLGVGRGFRAYPELAALPDIVLDERAGDALPNARAMARLGIMRLAAGEGIDPTALEPVYLRDRVALTEAERAREHRS